MEIIQTIKDCHKHWNMYDNWEKQNKENYAKKRYLFENYKKNNPDEIKRLKEKSDIVLRTMNILDNASENAAQNMQVAVKTVNALSVAPVVLISEFLFFLCLYKGVNHYSKSRKLPFYVYLAPLAFSLPGILDIPLTIWGTKKQIEASRVARAKAREKELKDIKNFVTYTPEQIQEARKKAELIDDKEIQDEDSQNITTIGAFRTTFNINKEYNKYLAKYYKNLGIDKKKQQKLSENFTDKELLAANKDKELLLTEIKDINNNAEKYCENAEAAISTLQMFNFLMIIPAAFVINKILNLFIKNKSISSGIIKKTFSAIIPIFLTLPLAIYYNNKTKEAAKVGRYKMKQKFNEDLSKGVYFDENELKKVKINCPQEKLNIYKRFMKNLKFIPEYLKEREEYLEYKKNQWIEEEKLHKALKTIPISDEQKKEAEKIQEKIFFVFDELDEMSQKYSEHMEGFTDLVSTSFKYSKALLFVSLPVLFIHLFLTGNMHITTIGKKLSDFILDKNSKIRNSIDEIYNIAKQDKKIKSKIDRALSFCTFHNLDLLNDPKIAKPLNTILSTFTQVANSENARKTFFEQELKHGKIANYFKNLISDILKLSGKKLQSVAKDNIDDIKLPQFKEILQNLKNIKIDTGNLKTLKLTAITMFVPVFTGIVGANYLLNTFLAHLQKKAGYIGVMKSINKLDKTKYFAIHETKENDKNTSNQENIKNKFFSAFSSHNLLHNFQSSN